MSPRQVSRPDAPDRPRSAGGTAPSRRILLGGLAAAMGALSGCQGIRLEDDAPHLPLPVRHPVPAEAQLRRFLSQTHQLAALAAGSSTTGTRALAPLHRRQAQVLHDALARAGVPAQLLAPPPSVTSTSAAPSTGTAGSPTASTAPGNPLRAAVAQVAAAERAPLLAGDAAQLSRCDPELRPTILSALAMRAAAAAALGRPVSWEQLRPAGVSPTAPTGDASTSGAASSAPASTGSPSPTSTTSDAATREDGTSPSPTSAPPPAVPPAAAADLLGAVRATAYLMEVVAGQAGAVRKPAALRTLSGLRTRAAQLEAVAGDQAPPVQLGYRLPFPVHDPSAAARLAKQSTASLLRAHGTALHACREHPDAALDLIRWVAEAQAWAVTWGNARAAFPGLS